MKNCFTCNYYPSFCRGSDDKWMSCRNYINRRFFVQLKLFENE